MTVSEEQVNQFREILEDVGHYPTDNRPVQRLFSRKVLAKEAD